MVLLKNKISENDFKSFERIESLSHFKDLISRDGDDWWNFVIYRYGTKHMGEMLHFRIMTDTKPTDKFLEKLRNITIGKREKGSWNFGHTIDGIWVIATYYIESIETILNKINHAISYYVPPSELKDYTNQNNYTIFVKGYETSFYMPKNMRAHKTSTPKKSSSLPRLNIRKMF